MNRKERRNAEKRGITSKDLKLEHSEAVDVTVEKMIIVTALVLNDKFNFTKEDIEKAIYEIIYQFDSVDSHYMSFLDAKKEVLDRLQIKFTR